MSDRDALHPDELLDELLDGRLGAAERSAVERHLAGCERCRRLHAMLVTTRSVLRAAHPVDEPAPPALAREVSTRLAASSPVAPASPLSAVLATPRWRIPAALAASALLGIVAAWLWLVASPVDPIADVATLHRTASVTTQVASDDAEQLTRALAPRVDFPVRVFDLAMMGHELRGGGVAEVADRPATWVRYAPATVTAAGAEILCVMWRGSLASLSPAVAEHRDGQFSFRLYRRGTLAVVVWQEGDVLCALVGGGDGEALLSLARAKAMLPQPT